MNKKTTPVLGFHVAGTLTGIGDYMRRLDEAGLPFAVCSVGEGGLIGEAAQYTNADHWIVYRQNHDAEGREIDLPLWTGNASNYTESTESYAARLLAAVEQVPEVAAHKDRVWLGVLNECDQVQADWLHSFSLDVARILNAAGWRVVLLNWATGTPFLGDLDDPPHLELLRYASANRDVCALGIHEYSLDGDLFHAYPYLVGRWQFYADVCREYGIPLPQFVVKEFGWFAERTTGLGTEVEVDQIRELMTRDNPSIPRMLWSSAYWPGSIRADVERLIRPVTAFVLSERFEVEPLPIDEEPPMSEIPEEVIQAARIVVETHPSYVGVVSAENRPALLRSIDGMGEDVASSEIPFKVGNTVWKAQAGRADETTDERDTIHLWTDGMPEAVPVPKVPARNGR